MVIVAHYSKDNCCYQDEHRKQVSLSRTRLTAFPTLNRIFNNFKGYENLAYKESRNIVFVKCCKRPNGLDEEGYPEILKALEEGLRMFDLYSWRKKIYNVFVKRLTQYDYNQSEAAVSEVLTAYFIGNKIGFDRVFLHPPLKNDKNGDVLIAIKGRRLFIEVTSLRERESEMKIRHAFCELAKHLSVKCISKNYAITVYMSIPSVCQKTNKVT